MRSYDSHGFYNGGDVYLSYVTTDEIIQARQIDLLTYLQNYEPENLIKVSRDTYCTREHDSLIFVYDFSESGHLHPFSVFPTAENSFWILLHYPVCFSVVPKNIIKRYHVRFPLIKWH